MRISAPVAQWIERRRPKAGVGSSNLSGGANITLCKPKSQTFYFTLVSSSSELPASYLLFWPFHQEKPLLYSLPPVCEEHY